MIDLAKSERRRVLAQQEQLERVTGSGGTAAYEPGERWRNNKYYLIGDTVTDGNGKPCVALQDSLNKPPANNPDFWKYTGGGEIVYSPWSNFPVGTTFYGPGDSQPQSHVKHNGQDWDCLETHVKAQGNAPRAGSAIWGRAN